MARWFRDNSLTIVLSAIFLISLVGQALSGWHTENDKLAEHGAAAISLGQYLASGEFASALFENWESEFLQMGAFVLLTAHLFQRGSPESRDPDEAPRKRHGPVREDSPWPARAGGLAREVYAHSLSLVLFLLFLASFVLHWLNSARAAADEARLHGEAVKGAIEHLAEAEFWFESFQNWQSEFLSTAVLIVLAIFLRERDSPESKKVTAPHSKTGAD